MPTDASTLLSEATAAGYDKLSERELKECLLAAATSGSGSGGVTQIVAGLGISVSPVGGTGAVTVSAISPASSFMQGFFGNYAGGTPSVTPTSDVAKAFDTSNGAEWSWYAGAWH